MKYRVNITNISFDLELIPLENSSTTAPTPEPLPQLIPPVIPQLPETPNIPNPITPTPPVQVGVENITQQWMDTISDESVYEYHIPEGVFKVDHITRFPVSRNLKIVSPANRSTVIFGKENYDRWTKENPQFDGLVYLKYGARVLIDNINLCQPKQLNTMDPWRPNIFTSEAFVDSEWTAAVRNCDTTILGRHGGMGLGFVYGGLRENHLAAINFKHAGNLFLDGKAGIGKNPDTILCITLQDVITDGANEEEFGHHKVAAQAVIRDNVYHIISDAYTWQMRNQLFDQLNRGAQGNYAHIIHVGRFTFMLDPDQVIDEKRIRLRPNANGKIDIKVIDGHVFTVGRESHAGDQFMLGGTTYHTLEKHRTLHPFWSNHGRWNEVDTSYTPFLTIDKDLPDGIYTVDWKSSFDLEGIPQPTWMLYKESPYKFPSTPKTKFEDPIIMSGGVIGHNMYNHNTISLWAKNVKQTGYYRQSANAGGKCLYYHMVNCEGFKNEFNPPIPVTADPNFPMPQRILDLIT